MVPQSDLKDNRDVHRLVLEFDKHLNRNISYIVYPDNSPFVFTVKFNTFSSKLSILYEGGHHLIRQGLLHVNFYRDMTKSEFITKYLDIDVSFKNGTEVYKTNTLKGIKDGCVDIKKFMYEKYEFNGTNNYMDLNGFKFTAGAKDLFFFYIQRYILDDEGGVEYTSSMAVQVATNEGLDNLLK
jgi:hypothetical protein